VALELHHLPPEKVLGPLSADEGEAIEVIYDAAKLVLPAHPEVQTEADRVGPANSKKFL